MNTGGEIIERIFNQIHLNPKYPKYFNIYIPNTRKNNIMIFIDGEWIEQNKRITLCKLIDNIIYYLDDEIKIMEKDDNDRINLWFNFRQAKYERNLLLNYNGNYYTATGRKTEIFKSIESQLFNNKTMILNNYKKEKHKIYSLNNKNNISII